MRRALAGVLCASALGLALSALAAACDSEPAPSQPSAAAAVAAGSTRAAPAEAPAKSSAPAHTVAPEPQIPVGLSVGNRAPDFEAQDVEGARIKLSDYRGKVVVLDFWGFW